MFTLETARLNLVLPEASEAEAVLDLYIRNQRHLGPTNPPLPQDFLTLEFWQKTLVRNAEEFKGESSARFFFELKSSPGRLIGSANLTNIIRGPFQGCFLGYMICGDHEGQGYMTEALERIVRYAFEDMHLHRIMANHLPENTSSAAVLKRLGFNRDGVSPAYLYIAGAWRDHVLNSLSNPHWTPREADRELFGV